jgi:hypothetical protein
MSIKQIVIRWCIIALPVLLAGPLLINYHSLFWLWGILAIIYIGEGFRLLRLFCEVDSYE